MKPLKKITAAALAAASAFSVAGPTLTVLASDTVYTSAAEMFQVSDPIVNGSNYCFNVRAVLDKNDLKSFGDRENPYYLLRFSCNGMVWDADSEPVNLFHITDSDEYIPVKNIQYSMDGSDLVLKFSADDLGVYRGLLAETTLSVPAGSSGTFAIEDTAGARWETTLPVPAATPEGTGVSVGSAVNGSKSILSVAGTYNQGIYQSVPVYKNNEPVQKGDRISVIMQYTLSNNLAANNPYMIVSADYCTEYFNFITIQDRSGTNLGYKEDKLDVDGAKLNHEHVYTWKKMDTTRTFTTEFIFECVKSPDKPITLNRDFADAVLMKALVGQNEQMEKAVLVNQTMVQFNLLKASEEKPETRPEVKPGFVVSNGHTQYVKADGSLAKDEVLKIDGKVYAFDKNGNMVKGWLKLKSGKWAWFNDKGVQFMNGWKQISGSWYSFDQQGNMRTGWYKQGSSWYYLRSSGEMAVGWIQLGNDWYYAAGNGVLVSGWNKIDGQWYFMDSTCRMKTGWLKLNWNGRNDWYFFDSNGKMKANESWYDTTYRKTFKFDSAGICLNP